jgi:hypothetical protein
VRHNVRMNEPMTKEEYIQAQGLLLVVAAAIENMDLERMIEAGERADGIAPILDPTLWMRGHKHLDAVINLARAALHFKQATFEFRATMKELKEKNGAALDPNVLKALGLGL